MSNRMLAVVRCGDTSLHTTWSTADRKFDVAVSYFGGDGGRSFSEARFVHRRKGGKWDGLFHFFKEFPQVLDEYDYFWLPDDDVASSAADVNRFFEIALEYGLDLCQPTLSWDSDYSHLITVHNSNFLLRYTNFVEIMLPLLSRELMKRSLPRMEHTLSGFGLDMVWPTWTSNPRRCVAIVDAVQMRHARKRDDGELRKTISKTGTSNVEELRKEMANNQLGGGSQIEGMSVPRIVVHGGVSANQHTMRTVPEVAGQLLLGCLSARAYMAKKPSYEGIVRYVGKTCLFSGASV